MKSGCQEKTDRIVQVGRAGAPVPDSESRRAEVENRKKRAQVTSLTAMTGQAALLMTLSVVDPTRNCSSMEWP